nr:uncharacterized protein LOC9270338 isoform X1 [Oryza sativa Japonica Group]XP_025882439.1 uncharacterized protein LOC9270338 isoform X1 [Oryza sativa Japonica Group]
MISFFFYESHLWMSIEYSCVRVTLPLRCSLFSISTEYETILRCTFPSCLFRDAPMREGASSARDHDAVSPRPSQLASRNRFPISASAHLHSPAAGSPLGDPASESVGGAGPGARQPAHQTSRWQQRVQEEGEVWVCAVRCGAAAGRSTSLRRRSPGYRASPMAHKGPDAPGVSGISSGSTVKLKDLAPAATNNVNTTFIVLDKAARAPPPPPHGRADAREETCLALVADETAAAHFLLWGAERDAFEPGDIVRLTGGIFSYHRSNSLVLRAGRRGRAEKVGEFTMLFVETPNMSEVKWVRDPGDPRRMVQEAVVSPHSQVFKPLQ